MQEASFEIFKEKFEMACNHFSSYRYIIDKPKYLSFKFIFSWYRSISMDLRRFFN